MRTHIDPSRPALRLLLAGSLLFAICAACTYSDGERASSGECPEGEVCSDTTPTGLVFYGALPGDDTGSLDFLRNLAIGGTQVLSFDTTDGTQLGAVDIESTAAWFVDVTPVDSPDVGSGAVTLRGLAEGSSHVRVLAPGTGELYDRVLIRVERIATVDVTITTSPSGALAPGELASAVFRLEANNGDRLVDEGMSITSSDVEIERVSWDCIDFVAPTDGDEVSFVLDAGHRRWEVRVPVAR